MDKIFDEVRDRANEIVNDVMGELMRFDRESRPKTHLDPRALGGECYYGRDCIVTTLSGSKSLNYYGGFEYIDEEFITVVGDYVFYSVEAERVRNALEDLVAVKVRVFDIEWTCTDEELPTEVVLSNWRHDMEEFVDLHPAEANNWIQSELSACYGHTPISWEFENGEGSDEE